jgi:serine phosphatase RsbU (regulator of sigma subunit)
LKKAVCFKEIAGRAYRLVAPHEVLDGLNREMMALAIADSPFISMVYALFDGRDRTLVFARAGHPHPIHVPRRGEPKLCPSHGTLLGVFETQFTTQTLRLRPGDKLLLHTDGLDALTSTDKASGSEFLLALAKRYGQLPVQEFVSQVARDLIDQTREPEDFTLLGLEVGD